MFSTLERELQSIPKTRNSHELYRKLNTIRKGYEQLSETQQRILTYKIETAYLDAQREQYKTQHPYTQAVIDELGQHLKELRQQPPEIQIAYIHRDSIKGQKLTIEQEFTHIPYVGVDAGYLKEIYKVQSSIEKILRAPYAHTDIHPPWNLTHLDVQQAHAITQGDPKIKVGVIDTGVDYNHKDLQHLFETTKGYNFIDETTDPIDDNGHGTHVAGTIAGVHTGIAPKSRLYALKVLNKDGMGREGDFLKACEYAITHNIPLLNASLGSTHFSPVEEAMMKELNKRNIQLVAAAGNSGVEEYNYPASYNGVISVAATDENNNRAAFSTKNDKLTISAPGTHILSTTPDNTYQTLQGTSMATPHITGIAALYASIEKQNFTEDLQRHAKRLGRHKEYGAGIPKLLTLLQ